MTIHPDTEAMARVLCKEDGDEPDRLWKITERPCWEAYADAARVAWSLALSRLRKPSEAAELERVITEYLDAKARELGIGEEE